MSSEFKVRQEELKEHFSTEAVRRHQKSFDSHLRNRSQIKPRDYSQANYSYHTEKGQQLLEQINQTVRDKSQKRKELAKLGVSKGKEYS